MALSRFLGVLLLAAVVVGCAPASTRTGLDAALREAVHSVPVAGTDASIVVTSFRPPGDGPFPWIVLSHGTATTPEANRAIGRYREYCRDWEQRGWRLDTARVRADEDRVSYAIPSPGRRLARGWVLPSIPLVTPADPATAGARVAAAS